MDKHKLETENTRWKNHEINGIKEHSEDGDSTFSSNIYIYYIAMAMQPESMSVKFRDMTLNCCSSLLK